MAEEDYYYQPFGVYTSKFVRAKDPHTGEAHTVPLGQHDVTFDSTTKCPHCDGTMKNIQNSPATNEIAYPFHQTEEGRRELMNVSENGSYRVKIVYYCPNPNCDYYKTCGRPYEQERTEQDCLITTLVRGV